MGYVHFNYVIKQHFVCIFPMHFKSVKEEQKLMKIKRKTNHSTTGKNKFFVIILNNIPKGLNYQRNGMFVDL